LYSVGKDSSVLLRLAQKAFHPARPPFPLLHVDTTFKFLEMIEFRDRTAREAGLELIVHTHPAAAEGANPFKLGTQKCCHLLKTRALLDAIAQHGIDAAIGGARREEEKSRAKERVYSFRDSYGQWDPRTSARNCGTCINGRIDKGESIRAFPLSNWTELDVWEYIAPGADPRGAAVLRQAAPHVAARRAAHPLDYDVPPAPGDRIETVLCRMRSLGCTYCNRGHSLGGGYATQDHRRTARLPALGTREPRDRPRPGRLHGTEEARGVLLMKDLLRFTTAGSVDDGKSTLIGRLLHDTRGVYEDQLESVRKASRDSNAEGFDLSLITDGLRAEREQAITIDVAYRYFQTPRRKFIIADTPGHEQYTRNMATGASTASLAVILLDARHGVLQQSRRHAYIAALLGIRKLAVAVNKMDLVDFRRDVFERIRDEFGAVAAKLDVEPPFFVPVSARDGDNVARHGARTPWYEGPSLLEYLETVEVVPAGSDGPLRFPVQLAIRAAPGFSRLRRADRFRQPARGRSRAGAALGPGNAGGIARGPGSLPHGFAGRRDRHQPGRHAGGCRRAARRGP